VQALGKLAKTSFVAVNALLAFLLSTERGYCRVRGMAAAALAEAASAATNWQGLDMLLKHYRDRSFDPLVARCVPRDNAGSLILKAALILSSPSAVHVSR
jgi:hypothetical protein